MFKSWNEIETKNPVGRSIRAMRKAVETVITNDVPDAPPGGALLYGPGGWGKTTIVNQVCDAHGIEPIQCEPSTYRDVLNAVELGATSRRPVVFDDPDLLLRNDRALAILKKSSNDDPRNRFYNGHRVDAAVFITTNEDMGNTSAWHSELKKHGPALNTRFRPVGVPDDRIAQREYTIGLALYRGLISHNRNRTRRSARYRAEVLDWFWRNAGRLESLSPRALIGIADAWEEPDAVEREISLEGFLKDNPGLPMGCAIDFEETIKASFRQAA